MDWVPTLKPDAFMLCDSHAAPPGSLLYVRRGGRTDSYLTFGEEGRSSRWLSLDAPRPYRAFDPGEARPVNAMAFNVSGHLRLNVRPGPPDADRMPEPFGCVGVSTVGAVICARQPERNFGGDAATYLCLSDWRHLMADNRGWFNNVAWFSNWELLYFDDETRERHRLLGSPDWNGNA